MFDLLLLVLVAQQASVSIRQLVQLLLVCSVFIEQRLSLCCEGVELFLCKHMNIERVLPLKDSPKIIQFIVRDVKQSENIHI